MLQIEMNRMAANLMSQSVTPSEKFGLLLLQIETNRPAKSRTATKVPVPFAVVYAGRTVGSYI